MPASYFRDRYAIVGVGQSELGEIPEASSLGLLTEAMRRAVDDAGLHKNDVDAIISRGPDDIYSHHQRVGQLLGINAGFSTTLDNGGASQILAVVMAVSAIEAGLCEVALCGYGRDAWARSHRTEDARIGQRTLPGDAMRNEFGGDEFGYLGAPAPHAFGARRHMALYGTTKEQMGAVAVSFREHAVRNPAAQMRTPLSLDEYLAGRPIVDPFNLYDCSLRTDGAGAVVVTSVERARDLQRHPILISGFGSHNNLQGWFEDDHMTSIAAGPSAKKAYGMAGVGPGDVDVFEVYDCFTYMVIAQLEAYGFCGVGEGGPFAESGALGLNGALPTNTAGGQLSEGHVEGMLQIVEAVRQLRHEHDLDRQVDEAEIAAVSGHGGNTVCHSSLILKRA